MGKIGIEPTRYPGPNPAGDRIRRIGHAVEANRTMTPGAARSTFARATNAIDRYTPQGRLPKEGELPDRPRRSSASVENISAITIAAACATQVANRKLPRTSPARWFETMRRTPRRLMKHRYRVAGLSGSASARQRPSDKRQALVHPASGSDHYIVCLESPARKKIGPRGCYLQMSAPATGFRDGLAGVLPQA